MVPEVILHVGMHKTGTTSIQSALNNFDDGTVRYAQLNDVNHSIPIYSLFSKNKYEYQIHKNFGRTPAQIDAINDSTVVDLERELSMDREKIIISGEDISALKPDEVQSLVTWIKAQVGSLKVLAYVRDPVGFASSVLQQGIYGGMQELCIPTPDYRNRFEAYTQCSEVDGIEFVEFKKNELVDGSVVSDFCSRGGFDGSGLKEQRVNESMSVECAQLLYHFNRFGVTASGNAALVNSRNHFSYFLSQNFKGDSFKIPKDWVWANMRMDDIAWMENVSGIQLAPPDSISQNSAGSSDVLEEVLGNVESSTLCKLQNIVSEIDSSVGCDTDVTNLLGFLFASFYFKESHAQEKAAALAAERKLREELVESKRRREAVDSKLREKLVESRRQEEAVVEQERLYAKQHAVIAQKDQEIEGLRQLGNEAESRLAAMEHRGVIDRLLNRKAA